MRSVRQLASGLPLRVRSGPRCKSKTGRQNQDRSRLNQSQTQLTRPVFECSAPQI